ncbi:MAG: class I SAM-dependent methyltransferase [Bacteroidales bacterium]|nr:class I SAM-dependent methyltransferase [Bacteroidales bacterium]
MKKFLRLLLKIFPRPWLIRFSGFFTKLIAPFYRGHNVTCPVCEKSYKTFLPYGYGNGIHDNRLCPGCLTLERHRLLWLYLKNKTNLFTDNLKFLHIAPEQPFYKRFQKMDNLEYITADLESPIANVKMDIQDIPFDNESFDVVICNHVLEHVDDDRQAMREVYRILKKSGWAILQVPIDNKRETTYENNSITTPEERQKHFGQYDHRRVHGKDYGKRLAEAGFKVIEDDFVNTFTPEEITKFRFDKSEIIYMNIKE